MLTSHSFGAFLLLLFASQPPRHLAHYFPITGGIIKATIRVVWVLSPLGFPLMCMLSNNPWTGLAVDVGAVPPLISARG